MVEKLNPTYFPMSYHIPSLLLEICRNTLGGPHHATFSKRDDAATSNPWALSSFTNTSKEYNNSTMFPSTKCKPPRFLKANMAEVALLLAPSIGTIYDIQITPHPVMLPFRRGIMSFNSIKVRQKGIGRRKLQPNLRKRIDVSSWPNRLSQHLGSEIHIFKNQIPSFNRWCTARLVNLLSTGVFRNSFPALLNDPIVPKISKEEDAKCWGVLYLETQKDFY